MRQSLIEKEKAIETLRQWLKPGDTVYTVLRSVSRSGMTREISVFVQQENGPFDADYWVSKAIGYNIGKKGLRVGGCGMDMGFHIAYSLGRVLWPEGYECIGKTEQNRCPSNDHFNGDRNYEPHKHTDGGYALRHRWL